MCTMFFFFLPEFFLKDIFLFRLRTLIYAQTHQLRRKKTQTVQNIKLHLLLMQSFFDKQIFPFSLKKLYNIKKHTKDIFITYTRHLSP